MPKRGRPSKYDPEAAEEICCRLSEGESLRAICRDEHLPPATTVRTWIVDDREGFSVQYARARDAGLDAMAEETLEIVDDGRNDWMERQGDNPGYQLNGEHVQRSRLRVDTRKWYLSKLAPKRYGDRLVNAYEGADGNPADPPGSLSDLEIARKLAFILTKGARAAEG